jgi:hypothetical protein
VASWRQGEPGRSYKPENPKEEITKYIEANKIRLKLEQIDFNYRDFVAMYEAAMRRPFDFRDTRYVDIAPYKDGHYIQKLSTIVDKCREKSILLKVERSINDHSKVLIIYGSGHYLKHRPVLKKAFDSEEIEDL